MPSTCSLAEHGVLELDERERIMLNAPFDSFPLSREVSFTVPETVPLDADESWWEARRVLS